MSDSLSRLFFTGVLCLSSVLPLAAQDDAAISARRPPPVEYMGRRIAPTMHYSGAGWLTRPTREQEEKPQELLDALQLERGATVCDYGSGNGYHTLQLARRVGPRGTVVAVDIQPEMLELLEARATPRGVDNVELLLVDPVEPELPLARFDLVLMVDVYHEVSDPAAVLKSVRQSLRPEGRLVLVEFREEDPEVPIRPLHKMSQQQVLKELQPAGYKLVGQYDELPWQHVLTFARDDSPRKAIELTAWEPPE